MGIRVAVANAEQADAVWQLLQHASDELFPVELSIAGVANWTATRTPLGVLTALAPAPQARSCPVVVPAEP
jgi:hypothetical protein